MSNYTASADLLSLLGGSGLVFNSGILGGLGPTFRAFLALLVQRTSDYYAAHPSARLPPQRRDEDRCVVDMPIVNELILERGRRRELVVTGWPDGPLNAPMSGQLCRARYTCPEEKIVTGSGRQLCRREALANISRRHFFRHKLDCGSTIPCKMDRAPPDPAPSAGHGLFPWFAASSAARPRRRLASTGRASDRADALGA